jgi:predicted nucleic acid-binding Zn ribbon protein
VIHPVGVVFKGSGWYINDSRSKNSTNTPTETSTSDTKSESTSTTTETPAAKTEPVKTAAD